MSVSSQPQQPVAAAAAASSDVLAERLNRALPLDSPVVAVALSAADAPQIDLLPRTVYATRRLVLNDATTDNISTATTTTTVLQAEVDEQVLVCAVASPTDRLALIAELDRLSSKLNDEADAIVTAREEDTHIRLLHEYNETRDAAQVLFGQLATLDGLTIQDLYERFGVSLDD